MAHLAQNSTNNQFDKCNIFLILTPHERKFPDVLNGSRKRRITTGSGTSIQDLNRLIKT